MTEQLISGHTSSIGAVWPPEVDDTHHRLRGFYPEGVVRTAEDVSAFAAHFVEQDGIASDAEEVSRLSIRVVAHAGTLAMLERSGVHVEAALPLANTEPDLVIAYTASNHDSRSMSADHLARHRSLLVTAVARDYDPTDRAAELDAQGFTPRLVDPQDAVALTPRFLEMYSVFGYTEGDVTELLGNTDNTIVYVEEGGRVVSTAMAESGTIAVNGLPELNAVEITEARTHPAYVKRGLYKAVSGYLVNLLLQQRGSSINVIFGENNLAEPGVLFAAQENGRRFSHFDAAQYGITREDFGILVQNFHVGGGTETRPYNDFAPSYVPLG